MTTNSLAQEAARIVCEELLLDYGTAKRKAAERMGLGPRAALPDNAAIQQAVIEYQNLFGGETYREHLRRMRLTAVKAMKWLAPFSPLLVGGTINGAVTTMNHVQLHLFADQSEELDIFLLDRGQRFEQDERRYRYRDGSEERIALACFEINGIGVDAAVFPLGEIKRPPMNPMDGLAYKRLSLAEAELLA